MNNIWVLSSSYKIGKGRPVTFLGITLSQDTYLFQPHLCVVRHQFVPHVTAKILVAAIQTRGETIFCYPGNEHILEAAKLVTWVGVRRNSRVFCRPPLLLSA